jgi:DNA-binding transcriptional LysR family regulator
MREVNMAGVDLNLLPALEALIRRRNVTRAGEDVGLSQPAMSRALARLRELLDDPVLVKTPGGLTPTARAKALLPQVAGALDRLGEALRPGGFDAAALDRTFSLGSTDVHSLLLGPPLLARLRALAPRAGLRFEPIAGDVRERVEAGDVDIVFAVANAPLPPGALSETLAEDRLALVQRRGVRRGGGPWTLEEYAAREHVTVSIFGDRQSEIDAELGRAGLTRRIAFTTPHFLGALAAVGATDCVTTLSATLARRFADAFNLELHEPPLRAPAFQTTMAYSAARANDPGLAWLRARLREAAAEAYGAGG